MATIDADSHVIETDATWVHMDGADAKHRPLAVDSRTDPPREFWMIDGKLRGRRGNVGRDSPRAAQELTDIEARLRHMDELGTDIQVLYPSLWTSITFSGPEVELAICRSYNRWLGDSWQQSNGRLPWIAVMPLMSLDRAVEEAHWAKDHGACGVLSRGFEGLRHASDPYYYPLYAAASELNMPVCFHAGIGSSDLFDIFSTAPDQGNFMKFKFPVISSFHSLVFGGVPERFPDLRFGFIEVSSQWTPYVIHDIVRRMGWKGDPERAEHLTTQMLKDYRFYVACQTDDDLPEVLRYTGEDNVVMGTDYGHADTSSELLALQTLRETSPVSADVVEKILDTNARALYAL